jgi:hypothetical protein
MTGHGDAQVGCQEPSGLRSRLVILVDQAPKDVSAFHVGGESRDARGVRGDGHCKIDALVRALLVVVAHVLEKDTLRVPAADEQEPIKTLAPHRSHPALGVRICSRRMHRGADDLDAYGGEDLVKSW